MKSHLFPLQLKLLLIDSSEYRSLNTGERLNGEVYNVNYNMHNEEKLSRQYLYVDKDMEKFVLLYLYYTKVENNPRKVVRGTNFKCVYGLCWTFPRT